MYQHVIILLNILLSDMNIATICADKLENLMDSRIEKVSVTYDSNDKLSMCTFLLLVCLILWLMSGMDVRNIS